MLNQIVSEIRARGPISFARYMELCLYDPQGGYYRSGREKLGPAGDYYTSAQVHAGFARLLVRRWAAMWEELGRGEFTVLEMGAGRGEIAREAQAWASRACPEFAKSLRYIALEFGQPLPAPFRGCVFTNEFFDAQPVHVLRFHSGRLLELFVTEREGQLAWVERELSSAALADWVTRLKIEPEEGQIFEVSPASADWMTRFGALVQRGYVLTFDYGYRSRELNGHFPAGTLMTYRRHAATEDVLRDPGDRDITAHVNFDLLRASAQDAGLVETGFWTQGQYLMQLGAQHDFQEVFADCKTEIDRMNASLLLKNLLFGIGETIQVLEHHKPI